MAKLSLPCLPPSSGMEEQVEKAAEIGIEHNLALRGDGVHTVSLDTVIEAMRQTGQDMRSKYKETSLRDLAVNVVQC